MASSLWQDSARTIPVVASGDPVGSWDDLSGSGFHVLQATAGRRPLWSTGVAGLSEAIVFDGVDDYLRATAAVTKAQPLVIYQVRKLDAVPGTARNWWDGDAAAADRARATVLSTGLGAMNAGTALSTPAGGLGVVVRGHVFDGVSSYLVENGSVVASGDTGAQGLEPLTIGANNAAVGAANIPGSIAEMLLFEGLQDLNTVKAVTQYLAGKWA